MIENRCQLFWFQIKYPPNMAVNFLAQEWEGPLQLDRLLLKANERLV